jgi:hypothetical protein
LKAIAAVLALGILGKTEMSRFESSSDVPSSIGECRTGSGRYSACLPISRCLMRKKMVNLKKHSFDCTSSKDNIAYAYEPIGTYGEYNTVNSKLLTP